MDHQIGANAFQKRDHQLRGVRAMGCQNEERCPDDKADEHLKVDFLFCGEAQVGLFEDFSVAVDKTDDSETDERKKHQQDEGICKIGQSNVGTAVERTISTPPIVGVPAFFLCSCGPSSRINWPICNSRSRRISDGPKASPRNMAVRLAYTVRTVM